MSWHRVASTDEALRASPWLPVQVDRTALVIARQGDRWFAVQDRCTHAGCAFADEASIEGGTIVCGCHGSEFDLASGEVQRGPAEDPIRTFPVRVVDDRLEVEV